MQIYASNGVLFFQCDQTSCRHLCDSVSGFLPSFASAKIFDNLNIVLEHENKIGNLFQIGEDSDEKRSNEVDPYDTVELKVANAFNADFLSSSCSSSSSEVPSVEYDFSKCFVRTVFIQKYENSFPFDFYLNESIYEDFSSDSNAREKFNAKRTRTPIMEESGDVLRTNVVADDGTNLTLPAQRNVIYKFDRFFVRKESDAFVSFPHCVYSHTVNGNGMEGFIPIFGCTSVSQLENGMVPTDFTIKGEFCTFLHPRHALFDVLKTMCRISETFLIGIRRLSNESENIADVFSCANVEKKFEAFVITETKNRWVKDANIEGFFCPRSIVVQAVSEFRTRILPSISKTYDLTDFMNLSLSFYKSGVSFQDYDESAITNFTEDPLEKFEEHLKRDRHIKVQFKFSVMAFPKNHDERTQIMCCDV
jgi:hypothetical protein